MNYENNQHTMIKTNNNTIAPTEIDFDIGATIDECVEELLTYKKLGKSVFGSFNGHTLYSDTVTLDSAYKQITGQTKQEVEDNRKKLQEKHIKDAKERAKQLPSLTKFWMEQGREVLEEDKWESWDSIVPIRLHDLYHGLELGQCLDIIKILNNGTFEEAKTAIYNQGHSGISFSLICSMIRTFSSKGEDFVNYIKSN